MEDSPSQPRVKRQRIDKAGRFAALQRLKDLKGQKHKYEVEEKVDSVYDVVDEKEFARRANEEYQNDWIEDDGTGYLEDGRDFFEDEGEDSDDDNNKYKKKTKKRPRDNEKPSGSGKGSIRNLFSNAVPKKKKDSSVKLAEDDILADILGEMDTTKKQEEISSIGDKSGTEKNTSTSSKTNHKSEAAKVKEYMQNFMKNIKKPEETKSKKEDSSDDEMIDRILKPKDENQKQKLEQLKSIEPPATKKETKKESILVKQNLEKINEDHEIDDKKIKENNIEIYNDMDFSVLNDDANQFILEEPKVVSEEKSKSTEIEKPKEEESKSAEVKSAIVSPEEEYKQLLNNWENICNMDNFEEEIVTPPTTEEQVLSKENLKIWYWDAWEDPFKRPGQIFLFGKMSGKAPAKSICVHIENIERCLYLLPREYMLNPDTKQPTTKKVTFIDVYQEFNEIIATELGITEFRSRKVTRNFAFHVPDVNVPSSCEYLEIRYDGKYSVPSNKKICNNISYIFGTNTNALETFILERKIKGPCWLNINNFRLNENPLSWCKVEAICATANSISVAEEQNNSPPSVSLVTINVRTALNPKTTQNEIVMISCLVNNQFAIDKPPSNPPFNRHFCGFTRPISQNWPLDLNTKLTKYKSTKTIKLDTERALLSWFLATFQSIDPDLIVTHDANDCQLDIICNRIATIKIPMWSRIGRLRISVITGKKHKDFFIGRMICDVKQSAEELIKCRSYDLDTLCMEILKLKDGERVDVTNDDLYEMYETGDGLLKLITLTMQDCSYVLRMMCELNVIPLSLQITNICGNLMSRTLQGGRSERNEFLLLHAFKEKNYIVPDKKKRDINWNQTEVNTQLNQGTQHRKKAAYSGGLVLDPIKGFYDKFILLMDFNSLYPSIIQEYNICFTTIDEPDRDDEIPIIPDPNVEQGVLPRQIRRLVESRREVKKLMSNPDLDLDLKIQYNIRQLALKLTANSMYGCLGFSQSRFYAQHLAALVTHKGREILMNTKSWVQKLNYEVIYGDTDSIMINTNSIDYDQVFKIGHTIKQAINKIYKQIELDIDGVFKYLLLLKKKKYAALTIMKNKKGDFIMNQEHKGLDIVRRDWSRISGMAGECVLDVILSDYQIDEKIDNIQKHLVTFKENILEGKVPLPLLTITKQLTKAPKDYTLITTLPHVQIALRMNATRNKRFKKGDMISYAICEDGTENPPMQRAYHMDEIKSNDKLKIDINYYLAQQIHPVVSRLCEPIDGIDGSRIAECLGLDPNKFKAAAQKVQRERMEEGVGVSIVKTTLQKYRQCEKFKFTCITCKTENLVASAFKRVDNNYISVLQKCSNKECVSIPYQYVMSIRNELILTIRKCIQRFYENWLVCDDPSCNSNTRLFSHVTINNRPICLTCKQGVLIRQYSETDLFNQLSYFQYIFDITKHEQKNIILTADLESAYIILKETVNQIIDNSGYSSVNLSKIFAKLIPT